MPLPLSIIIKVSFFNGPGALNWKYPHRNTALKSADNPKKLNHIIFKYRPIGHSNRYLNALKTSEAFVPPKPKELDNDILTDLSFASKGTRSIPLLTEGL